MKKSTITIAVVVVLLLIFIPIIHGAIEVKRRVKLEEGESPSLVVSIDDMVSDKQSRDRLFIIQISECPSDGDRWDITFISYYSDQDKR